MVLPEGIPALLTGNALVAGARLWVEIDRDNIGCYWVAREFLVYDPDVTA